MYAVEKQKIKVSCKMIAQNICVSLNLKQYQEYSIEFVLSDSISCKIKLHQEQKVDASFSF